MHAKVFNLRDAVVILEENLRLKVDVRRLVKVDEAHPCEALRLAAELRRVGLVVEAGGEEAALHPLAAPELVVQRHNLVPAHRDPLQHAQMNVVEEQRLVELILDVGAQVELRDPVRVVAHLRPALLEVARDVRRRHVRDGFDVGNGGVLLPTRGAIQRKLLVVLLPAHLHQLARTHARRREAQRVHRLFRRAVEVGFQIHETLLRHPHRHRRLIALARELQRVDVPPLAQIINVVAPLLRDVEVHALPAHAVRLWRVVVLKRFRDDALVQKHEHRQSAHPSVDKTPSGVVACVNAQEV
mmetsp:Transcript_1104/g.4099  ORF Transcript_1104/g.4099 Transcript_1104/m.4099 type:complete len:299 (+) Transcript_1104:1698-2594(+)